MSRVTLFLLATLHLGCESGSPGDDYTSPQILGGSEISPETLNEGKRLYRQYCASCHGVDGSGEGPAAGSLRAKPRDFRTGDFAHKSTPGDELPTHEDLREVITKGVPERGMPGWAGLRPEHLDAIAHYIKTFSPRWQSVGER